MGQIDEEAGENLNAQVGLAGEIQLPEGLPDPDMVKIYKWDRPMTVFFLERLNGTIFEADEQQAALLFDRQDPPRVIGTSDQTTFYAFLKERVKVGVPIKREDYQRIMEEAWALELAEARKHPRRPQLKKALLTQASVGTAHTEDLMSEPPTA